MTEPLTDKIERVAFYPQPIDVVWNALTQPDKLVHWMCISVQPFALVPGETIRFTWDDEHFRVILVTVDPPHTLSWQWRPGSGEDPLVPLEGQGPHTTVRFTLESLDGGTRLTLIETGFAVLSEARHRQALAENNGGWDDCLAHLGRLLAPT